MTTVGAAGGADHALERSPNAHFCTPEIPTTAGLAERITISIGRRPWQSQSVVGAA